MRILPLAYYLNVNEQEDLISVVTKVSSITHKHQVSVIACIIYVKYAMLLIAGKGLQESYTATIEFMNKNFSSNPYMERFQRIMSGTIGQLEESSIQSSGYVIQTLEASLWSLLTSSSYEEAVLKAINLGDDIDTTGAVTGGLAGIYYGLHQIPRSWMAMLVKVDEINWLCDRFESVFR